MTACTSYCAVTTPFKRPGEANLQLAAARHRSRRGWACRKPSNSRAESRTVGVGAGGGAPPLANQEVGRAGARRRPAARGRRGHGARRPRPCARTPPMQKMRWPKRRRRLRTPRFRQARAGPFHRGPSASRPPDPPTLPMTPQGWGGGRGRQVRAWLFSFCCCCDTGNRSGQASFMEAGHSGAGEPA
ncbi:MAG: hypothetical protein J3K34DRAFT_197224 [Monoraphidium minutum]|nr:MAG: hypothetical protein J3K34DRAFT_197224 [Monoraphidium minutum]